MPARKRSWVVVESDDEESTAKEVAPVASDTSTREPSSEGNQVQSVFSTFWHLIFSGTC